MTDEAAFLAALTATPTDDVCRLVYADWLEEREQPEKANYLRLVCRAVEVLGTLEEAVVVKSLVAVSSNLSPEWRQAAAGRFGLVLWGIPGSRKIFAIKLLRELFSWGLAEAKSQSERLPNHLPMLATAEAVHAVRERFSDSIHTEMVCNDWDATRVTTPSPLTLARPYDISLGFLTFSPDSENDFSDGDAPPLTAAARVEIVAFVERVSESQTVPQMSAVTWDDVFTTTVLRRIPFREMAQRLDAIRPEGERIAQRHQAYFWLTAEPSCISTE